MIKFPIKIQENPKVINLELKGTGSAIALDTAPVKIKLGPVLPYNNRSYAAIELSNPSKYATELVSLDFDKHFKSEMELLANFE